LEQAADLALGFVEHALGDHAVAEHALLLEA